MATVVLEVFAPLSTGGDSRVSTAFTPAVGDQIVVFASATGSAVTTPTCTDSQGGTYTLAGATALKATSVDVMAAWVRDSLVPAASSTTVTTAGFGAGATSLNHGILSIVGVTRTGVSLVKRYGKQDNQAAGTPAVALGGAALTTNPLVGMVFNSTNTTSTTAPPTSWTEHGDSGVAGPTQSIEMVSINSGFTSSTVTWTAATPGTFCSIAIELDASAVAVTAVPDIVMAPPGAAA